MHASRWRRSLGFERYVHNRKKAEVLVGPLLRERGKAEVEMLLDCSVVEERMKPMSSY